MRIAFVWQGISGRYGWWKDGLYKAMKVIETKHEVKYFEPQDKIEDFKPDWILYWEAPITFQSAKDGENYQRICALPFKKALLFAGGAIESKWVSDFDHLFIESGIDMETCDRLGLPHSRAFGYNEDIMMPIKQPKIWDGIHQATSASWKRTWLMTEALKEKSIVCGRFQNHDPNCFVRAREHGAMVLPEQSQESVANLLNASHCVVQTSGYWGGGQRATLEGLACGIPVIAMSDSPKNCEFIRETGFGLICEPNPEAIKEAVTKVKNMKWDPQKMNEVIRQNHSGTKYANDILSIIE